MSAHVRVDVAFGGVAVVPLGPVLDAEVASRPSTLLLDNGGRVEVVWRWVGVGSGTQTSESGAPESAMQRHAREWLGPVPEWSTMDLPTPESNGLWLAVLTLPRECDGRTLVLGSRRCHLRTLDPSSRLLAPPAGGAWGNRVLRENDPMLAAAAHGPTTRWWARLLSDGLRTRIARVGPKIDPDHDVGAHAPADIDRFADPALEAWATQCEERWRWALDALAVDDVGLARLFASRLSLVPTIEGVAAPLAVFADPRLDQLRDVLLDPRNDARDRRNATLEWLDDQPASLAWVIDDAGPLVSQSTEPSFARTSVAVGVVNLTASPELGWVGKLEDQTADQASQALARIEPRSSTSLRAMCDVEDARELPPGRLPSPAKLAVHVGDDIVLLDAYSSPIAARPPGFVIPGLVADWNAITLASAARSVGSNPAVDTRTTGAIDRDETNRWFLRLDVGDLPASEQVIRLWLGLRRKDQTPAAEVRLRRAGLEPLTASEGGVEVLASRSSDGWILRFLLPISAIDPRGILRLGIERIGAGGRVSWPRPMLPWQMEPGRIGVDLGAWDQVSRGR